LTRARSAIALVSQPRCPGATATTSAAAANELDQAPETHSGESPTLVIVGGVEIDARTLQVAWKASAVHLPPREMAALLAVASDLGAPVRSGELAHRIWPGSI